MKKTASWILIMILLVVGGGGGCSSNDTQNTSDVDPDMVIKVIDVGYHPLGFELTIYGDGKVEYVGYPHDYPEDIYVQGTRSATISHTQLEQLVMAINESNFFSFEDYYTKESRDGGRTVIIIDMNGQSKRVGWDGFGCGRYYNWDDIEIVMPEIMDDIDPWEKAEISLCYLLYTIYSLTNVQQWVGNP